MSMTYMAGSVALIIKLVGIVYLPFGPFREAWAEFRQRGENEL